MRGSEELTAATFDLLVIGGGINGAAIARDAALRGLSVCIVDKADWGGGTSAKSSRLVHGGLRYLELFEFGLVHEALADRERLLQHAPHLVRPLPFLYPLYPHVASRRTVRLGLLLYDILSRGKSLPSRQYLSKEEVLARAPGLSAEGLRGGAAFYDAQVPAAERLVAETVADAEEHGAVCRNYAKVERLVVEDKDGTRRVSGALVRLEDGTTATIRSRATVNAAGCWVDEVVRPLAASPRERHDARPLVRKTKGIHVVVPKIVDVALLVRTARDGRVFFITPWGQHSLIGTTDTDYQGDAADAVAEPAEVAYLLDEARRYFPHADLTPLFTYAGVRALVNQEGVPESRVTRRHILLDHAGRDGVVGLWSLQGGKLTTARSLAEAVVDRIARHLGLARHARRHPTRHEPYPGGPVGIPWPEFFAREVPSAIALGLPDAAARHLVAVYGVRWRVVLDSDDRPEARTAVVPGRPHLFAEVTFAVREEQARHLGDVMLRRTDLGLAPDGDPKAAAAVLAWMADLLGWDAARQDSERRRYAEEVGHYGVPRPVAAVAPPPGPGHA